MPSAAPSATPRRGNRPFGPGQRCGRGAIGRSAVSDAGVKIRIQQVHYQIDEHEARGDDQRRALDEWHVAQRDTAIELEADARAS